MLESHDVYRIDSDKDKESTHKTGIKRTPVVPEYHIRIACDEDN